MCVCDWSCVKVFLLQKVLSWSHPMLICYKVIAYRMSLFMYYFKCVGSQNNPQTIGLFFTFLDFFLFTSIPLGVFLSLIMKDVSSFTELSYCLYMPSGKLICYNRRKTAGTNTVFVWSNKPSCSCLLKYFSPSRKHCLIPGWRAAFLVHGSLKLTYITQVNIKGALFGLWCSIHLCLTGLNYWHLVC